MVMIMDGLSKLAIQKEPKKSRKDTISAGIVLWSNTRTHTHKHTRTSLHPKNLDQNWTKGN